MPLTVKGNTRKKGAKNRESFKKDHGYDYPDRLDLRPTSDLHKKIVEKIVERAQASHNVMSNYKDRWRSIDKVLRMYVPPEADEESKGKRKSKKDDYADLIIPESYATMETILTYYMSSFIQDPIISYEGTGPEDVIGARLMTHLINHQVKKRAMGLNLHTQFRDDTAYGFGAVTPRWRRIFGKRPRVRQFGRLREDGVFEVTREEKVVDEDVLLYEGNELENINPYLYLPDVSVPIHEPQKGEYQGWIEETVYNTLLDMEEAEGSRLFNVKYLKEIDARSDYSVIGEKQHTRSQNPSSGLSDRQCDVIWMYIDIIPKEWGLSERGKPQKWLFALGGDEVLLMATPVDYLHGMSPVCVCASNFDGYSATPVSKLSAVHDIQKLINFMYTSHIRNVRKALNDMFLIDPSIVNYYDVKDPEPGKVIRTRRAAWGNQMLDHAFKQLDVRDVTQQHVTEAGQLGQLMRRVSASDNAMQGSMGGPGRTTRISAKEAGGAIGASLSRFQKNAQIIDLQSMQPLAEMLAKHTQQFMSQETYVKVTGDWPEKYMSGLDTQDGRLSIHPLDLVVDYDIQPTNGQIPGSEDPQVWTQLFQIASQNPVISQKLNWIKLFKHLGRNLGAKNVDDFIVEVRPDEQVRRQVEQGNLINSQRVTQSGQNRSAQ